MGLIYPSFFEFHNYLWSQPIWTKQESDLQPYQAVIFHIPKNYSYETPNASVEIFVIGTGFNQTLEQDKLQLEKMISDSNENYGVESNTRLVNSSYVTLSGDMPGYQTIYYDYSNDKNLKVLYLKALYVIITTKQRSELE